MELKGDESDLEIQKAVILAVSPAAQAKLDGEFASDAAKAAYVSARFDATVESLQGAADQDKTARVDTAENLGKKDGADETANDPDAAYKRMVQDSRDAHTK